MHAACAGGSLATTLLACMPQAHAQEQPQESDVLDEVVVTAQKRKEDLQRVPVSIQAIDSKKLEELHTSDFDSYAKYLPSLSFQTLGPGQAQLYVRGVTNGADGLRVGSLPLVGVYLDEQPVTTIGNSLDVHIYDIERVESLSGPQGTLFGASSMAGTLRIITNKPDPAAFSAGYDLELNSVDHGATGHLVEGYVNLPLSEKAAIRIVGFSEHDAGYIDNVRGPTQIYPTSGVPRDNADLVKKNFNDVDINGARAALKVDLNDQWSVTPAIVYQRQHAHGTFAYDPALGDLKIAHYIPERNNDRWHQASLTIEGRIANLAVTYSGGAMRRHIENDADYSDYSYFYDSYYAAYPAYFGDNFRDDNGDVIDPSMSTISRDRFTKQSHELRIATDQSNRVRLVAGAFYQRQTNHTRDEYRVANLASSISITGQPGILYMNDQFRVDRDRALFADVSFDVTGHLTLTGGIRVFGYRNTVDGFFGYGPFYGSDGVTPRFPGEQQCIPSTIGNVGDGRPCNNIDKKARGDDETHKLNLTYRIDDDRMVYATWSTGFRPGGINRNPLREPYSPDFLTNYELGWKTSWLAHRLRLNGAIFQEKWKDAQFGVAGLNNITEIINAGRAKIKGIEGDVQWRAMPGLTLSASATYLKAKLTTNSCNYFNPEFDCSIPGPNGEDNFTLAPAGSRLPVSPRFKMNGIARYEFNVGEMQSHVQGAFVYQGNVLATLDIADAAVLGRQPSYSTFDFAAGVGRDKWNVELTVENAFDKRGEVVRYTSCAPTVCTPLNVLSVRPRMIGLRFGQKF